ncbi:MAG: hypothetical protein GF330_12495 [Candidatus Eisenbacteria bacterium]|nr:hypothetical protein [Candidatus Eisenbacteria bacterium]
MTMGAHGLGGLHAGIGHLVHTHIPVSLASSAGVTASIGNLAYRLTRLYATSYLPAYLAYLTQHEYFGHGARYREFGYFDNDYDINLPPPLGDGGGWARRGEPAPSDRIVTTHEELAIVTGGVEANTLLAGELLFRWFRSGRIPNHEALLYLRASSDLPFYIAATERDLTGPSDQGDVARYIDLINDHAGRSSAQEFVLTARILQRQAAIELLNPLRYVCIWAIGYGHIAKGRDFATLPSLRLGRLRCLLIPRLALTPFGSEYCLDSLVGWDSKALRVTMGVGDRKFHRFWDVALRSAGFLAIGGVQLDGDLRLWKQPALELGGREVREGPSGLGGSGVLTVRLPLGEEMPSSAMVMQVGYKATGYTPGEALAGGPIYRFGLSF